MSARAVFFSEARGEGDRAREKRVKSALREASGREMERMRVASRWVGKRERDVLPRQGNGGMPARTLNLLNALARA